MSTQQYAAGEWFDSSSQEHIDVVSASTEQVIGQIADGSAADVDRVVAAARAAHEDPDGWSRWEPVRRAETLRAFGAALGVRADELVAAVSGQNGMPVSIGRGSEGAIGPIALGYYASLIEGQVYEETRPRIGGGITQISSAPVGVVAVIVPWNFPVTLAFFKLAPALAAGCTIVWKPAPETSLDAAVVLAAAEEAGIPPGVLNVVTGGRETGSTLVSHPGVDKVAFTGSTVAGKAIGETCGRLLRPVSLELGGKSAAVVLADADLPGHAEDIFRASFLNSGQTCYLSTRFLVVKERYDETVGFLAAFADSLKIGDPFDETTQVGPLATSSQRDKVQAMLARSAGDASRATSRTDVPDRGWFLAPTVLAGTDPASEIAREEVFGPVVTVTEVADEAEAVRLANDSAYGLAGTVWSEDLERAEAVARQIRTGTVGLNGFRLDIGSPFGGRGDSGIGQELGPEGLAPYLRQTTLYRTFA